MQAKSDVQSAFNCYRAGNDFDSIEISLKKRKAFLLSLKSDELNVHAGGGSLNQLEKFKNLGIAFESDGKRNKELIVIELIRQA